MEQVTVFVVGPTASGKTDLALALARELGAEVVSADSRQVYRDLDAGTAKPPIESGRAGGVPYHLAGFLGPEQAFDAGSFARLALKAIDEIRSRGRRVVVAGGTGLYLRALIHGLAPLPPRDRETRSKLLEQAQSQGRAALHERLRRLDPAAAAKIPANNLQRVVRALEVCELTGRPISESWARPPQRSLAGPRAVLSIEWPADELARRIEARARAMWPAILEETRRLVPSRYRGDEPGFQSLGYPEALACAAGALSGEEGLAGMIRTTLLYAKRQRTWLRGQLPERRALAGGPLETLLAQAWAALS